MSTNTPTKPTPPPRPQTKPEREAQLRATRLYRCCCDLPLAERKRNWVVIHYRCNYSAFNGYRWTPSDYSCVTCNKCGRIWRTKAKYADYLTHRRSK